VAGWRRCRPRPAAPGPDGVEERAAREDSLALVELGRERGAEAGVRGRAWPWARLSVRRPRLHFVWRNTNGI
jgi:hypothetical protein